MAARALEELEAQGDDEKANQPRRTDHPERYDPRRKAFRQSRQQGGDPGPDQQNADEPATPAPVSLPRRSELCRRDR